MLFLEVNTWFAKLSNRPNDDDIVRALPVLERYIVLLYHRTSNCQHLQTWVALEGKSNRKHTSNTGCPTPTCQEVQHTLLATFGKFPHPSDGPSYIRRLWVEYWRHPHWTDLPQASKSLLEVVKCNCTEGCSGNCKCKRSSLPCTELCKCKGTCSKN